MESSAPPAAFTSSRLRPGDSVDGYVVGERLNAGGTGYVFRAEARRGHDPGFPLVMKVPGVGHGEPVEAMVGFEMELMIHPALGGPHVPRLVAAGDLGTTPYLVMERIDGDDLSKLLDAAPLDTPELARIGAAIADALHSLHTQSTVHHDLKPENVILGTGGMAVLLDFGCARHERYPDLLAEETRFVAGSAPYLSPEQLRGRRGDPRSDLFALGAILYELGTGEPPFGIPATRAGLRDRLWRVPMPPRARNPKLPPWMQEVILRCLEPEADARYQSAAHVAFDLRHPDQVALTVRAQRLHTPRLLSQTRRWWRAREKAIASTPRSTRVILVAVDTSHPADARHDSIRLAARQVLSANAEHRMMFVSVVKCPGVGDGPTLAPTPSEEHLAHLVRLRRWVEPLGLPAERQSLHVMLSRDPGATLVELARFNHADLIVLGAPAPDEKLLGWWRSVASSVTANAPCSVFVVRAAEDAAPGTA